MDPTIKLSGTNAARASNDILTSSLDQNPYVSFRLFRFLILHAILQIKNCAELFY